MMNINPSDSSRFFKKAYIKGRKIFRYARKNYFAGSGQDLNLTHDDLPIIAVDAMGGDHAPSVIIEGCIRAVKELSVKVQIVGPSDIIKTELAKHLKDSDLNNLEQLNLEIIHSDDYISMDEKNPASAVRRNKKSSIMVAMQQVANKNAHGVVAAGSTGAAVAAALFTLKRISSIERPAIATRLPSVGEDIVMLDAGANADSTPFQIAQHAIMGSVYTKILLKKDNPTVGLLSIGEEPGKGNKLTKETYEILNELPSINFFGNVEGRVVANRETDIVVCDGFTGNIFLKTVEGSTKMAFSILSEALKSTMNTKLGALMCMPAFKLIKNKRLNPHDYGGAVLLGVGGIVVIGHGSSNDYAVLKAIKVAAEMAQANIVSQIEDKINNNEILNIIDKS